MKKWMIALSVFCLILGTSGTVWAEEAAVSMGEINSITDRVEADGEKGLITTEISGTTDAQGRLALPKYRNAKIDKLEVTEGTQTGAPEEEDIGNIAYMVLNFEEKNSSVALRMTQSQEETYKTKASKQKGTFPGHVLTASYEFVNNAPLNIGNYSLELAVPEGMELYGIIGYDPEENYSIFERDGVKYGGHSFGKLEAGEDVKLQINLYHPASYIKFLIWALVIVISAYFMYKNRDMLSKAKALKEQKKS